MARAYANRARPAKPAAGPPRLRCDFRLSAKIGPSAAPPYDESTQLLAIDDRPKYLDQHCHAYTDQGSDNDQNDVAELLLIYI